MEEKSAVITVAPKMTGFDKFMAIVEKIGRLSEELEEAIRELSDVEITVELETEVNQGKEEPCRNCRTCRQC